MKSNDVGIKSLEPDAKISLFSPSFQQFSWVLCQTSAQWLTTPPTQSLCPAGNNLLSNSVHGMMVLQVLKLQDQRRHEEQLKPGNMCQGWNPQKEALRDVYVQLRIWNLSFGRHPQVTGIFHSMRRPPRRVSSIEWRQPERKAVCAAGGRAGIMGVPKTFESWLIAIWASDAFPCFVLILLWTSHSLLGHKSSILE